MRYLLLLLALVAAPAVAQTTSYTIDLPRTCDQRGQDCRVAQPVLNPDGTVIGRTSNPSLTTGQVSVGTTATLVATARAGRQRITVTTTAANACAFGNAGVTTSTGFPLQPIAGASVPFQTSAAIYAACSATTTVGYAEEF